MMYTCLVRRWGKNNFSFDEKTEERRNFTLDEKYWGNVVKQNMLIINRLELGEQNVNQMNEKDAVVSLKSDYGERIDADEYMLF